MDQKSVIERTVQATGDLPAMPHIANLVIDKIADPRTTARQLHEIISKEQALAARILRIANSPFYGRVRKVTGLTDAIVIMGFDTVKSLVMTAALHDFFNTFGLIEKLLWEHSLGCATMSKKLAATLRFPNTEGAFLAGLMHDIGKVILNLRIPQKSLVVFQEVYNNPGVTFCDAEQENFGFNHAQVGELIARKWNFAAEIEEAIGKHHTPREAKISPALTCIVSLANSFCHRLELGPTKNRDLDLVKLPTARALRFGQESIDELLDEMESLKSQGAFSAS